MISKYAFVIFCGIVKGQALFFLKIKILYLWAHMVSFSQFGEKISHSIPFFLTDGENSMKLQSEVSLQALWLIFVSVGINLPFRRKQWGMI